MARIRTIKPELFRHEELYEAEQETGLPLRLAFAGLFCCADREGRFQWRPKTLKLDVLPHDKIDFSRVMDALATRQFIVRYSAGGQEFGAIPTWAKHQVINNRERASQLPEPPVTFRSTGHPVEGDSTRQARVDGATATLLSSAQVEGKGTGKEEEKILSANADVPVFDEFWSAYPTDRNMSKKAAKVRWDRLQPEQRRAAVAAIPGFQQHCRQNSWYHVLHAERFLSQERFEGYAAANQPAHDAEDVDAIRNMWGGKAGEIIDAAGEKGLEKFSTWLMKAQFDPGPPARIAVAKPFQRNQIERQLSSALAKVFGRDGLAIEILAGARAA